jgi:hypothetical protein
MAFYEVIIDVYSNKVIVLKDLLDYLYTLWPFVKVNNRPYNRGFVASYVRGSIHYAIEQLSSGAILHCSQQRLHTFPKTAVRS